jgi:glycosyltransferase involved in cell wall biosynthesis
LRVLAALGSSLPYERSGYTTRSAALFEALVARGVDLLVLTRPGFPLGHDPFPAAEVRLSGVRYRFTPRSRRGLRRSWWRRLAFSLRLVPAFLQDEDFRSALRLAAGEQRPQLIHAASNLVNALPAARVSRELGLPWLYDLRGLWEELGRATGRLGPLRYRAYRRQEAMLCRGARALVVPTELLAREVALRTGVGPERIRVVPSGADPGQWAGGDGVGWRRRHGIPQDAFVVGAVSSLVAYEGFELLVEAATRVPWLHLLLVGEGPAREPLAGLVADRQLGSRVWLPGAVPFEEVADVLAALDACCLPRLDLELCRLVSPLKPLEAMAASRPLVCADLPALREVVPPEAGRFHRPGSVDDLLRELASLRQDPTLGAELGRAGASYVRRERTWEAMAERLWQQYRLVSAEAS